MELHFDNNHMHFEPVVKKFSMGSWWRSMEGTLGAVTPSVSYLGFNSQNVTRWLYNWALRKSWLVAVDIIGRHARSGSYLQGSTCNSENDRNTDNVLWMLYWVYAVPSVCCTECILSSVYAIHRVCCTRCILYWVYNILGVCCPRCMLSSVYAVLSVCCTRCLLYLVYAVLGVCYHRCVLYSVLTHDHGMERFRVMT